MNRRTFLCTAVAGLAACAIPRAASSQANRPPNIVLIYTDDQGYGDLSCFDSDTIATPNIDSLGRDGMKFTDFHCAAPVCTPSRSGLMTGCYPPRVGMSEPPRLTAEGELKPGGVLFPNSPAGLHPDEITMAELLKGQGYATCAIGKWHLGHLDPFLPTKQGFDEYFGIPYSNDMIPDCVMRGEKIWEEDTDQTVLTVRYTEEGCDFIRRHTDQPFFLYMPHNMPHVPLFVAERFKGKSKGGFYGDVIEMIDWSVGEVLKTLDEKGLRDNTLVIFSTDNGPWLSHAPDAGTAGPLRGGKGTTFEGGMRVPTLMRWPGHIPAGTVCDELSSQMDLFPTIAAITGAPLPSDRVIDGKNILSLMEGGAGAKTPHEAFFYYKGDRLEAVRDGRFKLMFARTKGEEQPYGRRGPDANEPVPEALYDLKNDIGEQTNVIADHPDIVATLRGYAETMRHDLGDTITGIEGTGRRPYGMAPDGMLEAWMAKHIPAKP